MTRVAVLQSNYIPWKGYFDLIAAVDDFLFYDEVQYTKNDWRNRNRIKTRQGVQWLTVPVHGSTRQAIGDVEVVDPHCGIDHWRRLTDSYRRSPCFDEVAQAIAPLYLERPWRRLSEVNRSLIAAVCRFLGIGTRLRLSSDFAGGGDRTGRLVDLCAAAGASTYVSGPSARAYLDVGRFDAAGIEVEWFDYGGYPTYPQPWGPFVHEVTALDLLFQCGRQAPRYMKAGRA